MDVGDAARQGIEVDASLGVHRPLVEEFARGVEFSAQEDIRGVIEIVAQRELLEDRRDSQLERCARSGDGNRLTVEEDHA